MEFLRFGSSIPGGYWGCCACCIIQNFKFDPDAKASIQLVSGDGGGPLTHPSGGAMFAGPTYRDIFNQRIRVGTFDSRDMPNHAFLAILTDWQLNSAYGKKWLAILKEAGFEFVRTVSNSVYTGQSLLEGEPSNSNANYIFGLFRNIGIGAINDQFTPPKQWLYLPEVKAEPWQNMTEEQRKDATDAMRVIDTDVWNKIGKPTFLTEEEVVAAGAPVVYAGIRSKFPQQTKAERDEAMSAVAEMGSADAPWANAEAEDCDECDCDECTGLLEVDVEVND